MATTSDVGIGSIIRYNGDLCQVVEWQHRTPGNLRAFYQGKMRNLKSGKLAENRFRTGEEVELARVEYKELQYLYKDGPNLVVMDEESYEQVMVPEELFGEALKFMSEGMKVKVAFENEMPLLAEAPTFVELEVTYCEPGLRGDTANNVQKPATTSAGAVVSVPIFVNEGDKIKVDTRTGTYVERVR